MNFLNIFTETFDWFMSGGKFKLWVYAFFIVIALVIFWQTQFVFKNRNKGQGLGRQSWKVDLDEDLVRLIKTKELNL